MRSLDGGFQTLNTTVLGQMREWLIENVVTALRDVGLRFEPRPVQHRVCCAASGDQDDWSAGAKALFDEGCDCHDDHSDDDEEDQRLGFGNWYMEAAGTKDEMDICPEHYEGLSRFQKCRFHAVSSLADLGDRADNYAIKEHELVGDVAGGAEAEANAASLLIAASNMWGEMSQANVAWDDMMAAKKAVAIRTKLFGPRDLRTAEGLLLLSRRGGVDDDEE